MINPRHEVMEMVARELRDMFLIGVVTGTSGNNVTVRVTRQGGTQTMTIAKNAAYGSPTNGDVVRILGVPDGNGGRTYEVMYRIVN